MSGELHGAPIDYAVIVGYFLTVVGFGLWFGKYTRNTSDYFFGGQRFSWWLIAFSGIATTVGSYSFVKYSDVGFRYGLSSSQTYMNDWFWIPVLLFLWLPILYFSKIKSVPEYFERRFGTTARLASIVLIMLYLVGYVGINLYTLGQVVESLLGVPIMWGASVTAVVVMLYMFAGGQTSVIMTDLAQGVILLIAGLGLFFYGVWYVGGFADFWALLPRDHKFMFSEFNSPPEFSFIGIYGQDGLANTGAFILMNQGMIMRFLSLKSVKEAQKMAIFWILVLYPVAAITVSSGGWLAAALVNHDPQFQTEAKDAFIDAAAYLAMPGVFGFIPAALTAALMSTADTLITAVSAVFLNDIYRPYVAPNRDDRHYLRVARVTSTIVVFVGIALVVVFKQYKSIYTAHGMFTAAVTPPIVVAIFMGLLSKRYTTAAALATMIGGTALIGLSFLDGWNSWLLDPFSFGMGERSYSFTRALFGLTVCTAIGFIVTPFSKPRTLEQIRGLVNGTQLDAMRAFKGSPVNRKPGKPALVTVELDPSLSGTDHARVPSSALMQMAADPGDLLYVTDTRWWFGGLRSVHVRAGEPAPDGTLLLSPDAMENARLVPGQQIRVEKIL